MDRFPDYTYRQKSSCKKRLTRASQKKNILKSTKGHREETNKFILIVEDEFDLGATLSMLFELYGFTSVRAHNGRQALDLLKVHMPDLVLSDCMMPEMDGVSLSRTLRADPATSHIPIVLMSAAPQQHDLSAADFDAFIEKPFQFLDLLDTIRRLLAA
jgi:CheY-like chemotaxis protein